MAAHHTRVGKPRTCPDAFFCVAYGRRREEAECEISAVFLLAFLQPRNRGSSNSENKQLYQLPFTREGQTHVVVWGIRGNPPRGLPPAFRTSTFSHRSTIQATGMDFAALIAG